MQNGAARSTCACAPLPNRSRRNSATLADHRRPAPPATRDATSSRRLRWAVALALVLIVHLVVLVGLVHMPGPLIPLESVHAPVLETILLPPAPIAAAPHRPKAKPKPKPAPPS